MPSPSRDVFDDMKDEHGRYIVPDGKIVNRALEIFDIYRRRLIGIGNRPSSLKPKYAEKLYAAAKWSIEASETADEYVDRQFTAMAYGGWFTVPLLCSTSIRKRIDKASDDESFKIALAYYRSQLNVYHARGPLYGKEAILRDEQSDFSPLFRFAMATEGGFTALARSTKQAAAREYQKSSHARRIFGFLAEALGLVPS